MGLQNKGTYNEQLFCYTEVQTAEVNIPTFSILSLSSRRKLVTYLNSSLHFPLKNVIFYQGMMSISKLKHFEHLLAYASTMHSVHWKSL